MDNLHEKVLSALKNCVDNPKCRDCPWEECEGPHAHVQLPKGLVEAVIGLLKEKDVSDTNVGTWVSVKDRLPEKAGWYLVYYNGSDMAVAFFKGKTWPFDNHYHKITHWLTLPEPPKEET